MDSTDVEIVVDTVEEGAEDEYVSDVEEAVEIAEEVEEIYDSTPESVDENQEIVLPEIIEAPEEETLPESLHVDAVEVAEEENTEIIEADPDGPELLNIESVPDTVADSNNEEVGQESSGDYTQTLESIKTILEAIDYSADTQAIISRLDEENDYLITMNNNIANMYGNILLYAKYQLGFTIAIFGALIVYFFFSKVN